MTTIRDHRTLGSTTAAVLLIGILGGTAHLASNPDPESKHTRERILLTESFRGRGNIPLTMSVVEVSYGPGEFSPPHIHPCPVLGYVVKGSLRMRVNDEAEILHRAGEWFFEPAHAIHKVSANASDVDSATFIAVVLCNHDTSLSLPVPTDHL